MKRRVLDSYALIAFFENQKGADVVEKLIHEALNKSTSLFLSVVNWGEIFYITSRSTGEVRARRVMQEIERFPIQVIPADKELTQKAATFKASYRMSYADCFSAALATLHHAELVTGDKEFKEVEKAIPIVWI